MRRGIREEKGFAIGRMKAVFDVFERTTRMGLLLCADEQHTKASYSVTLLAVTGGRFDMENRLRRSYERLAAQFSSPDLSTQNGAQKQGQHARVIDTVVTKGNNRIGSGCWNNQHELRFLQPLLRMYGSRFRQRNFSSISPPS